jgi:HlyD family secretion protein
MRILGLLLLIAVPVAGGAAYYATRKSADSARSFQTATVKRGEIVLKKTATGTVEPEELVDVGAQVMGLITGFGKDSEGNRIDYNSVVEEGTELAYIDKTPYAASLEQAEAALERSKADLQQCEVKLEQAENDWKRAESLRPGNAISHADYDMAVANYKSAKASVAIGKAAIRQNEAALKMARTNLGYTIIKSPIRGVILARRVNIGQTVVASLNAPSLFLIAKDLRRMQVWASVSEADIGRIFANMPVQFKIDAHPDETFQGTVTQIRMNAQMTQNVVTYTVVVTTDNSNGKLLPYLTASLEFEVERRSNVLLVPSSALSWSPQPSQIAPEAAEDVAAAIPKDSRHGCLWIDAGGGKVRPIAVSVGIDDLVSTEVGGDGIREGMQVVVGDNGETITEGQQPAPGGEGEEKTSSPFMPKPPSGKRGPPPPPM